MTGLLTYCGCCCIAAFIFIIAMAIYTMARGGMAVRFGNYRMRPASGNTSPYDPNVKKLETIRNNEKVLCDKCGAWADAYDSFCPYCGTPIAKNN